jgi:fluoride exporter
VRGLYIALGAGIGAPSRYILDSYVKRIHSSLIPVETLLINVLGSFVLGVVITSHENISLIFGTGFAGAFTTWSTFAIEAHNLFDKKHYKMAWLYLALTLVLGISAAAIGAAI